MAFDHLNDFAREFVLADKETRMEACEREFWLDTPQTLLVERHLDRLFRRRAARDQQCLIVTGAPSVGKARLVQNWVINVNRTAKSYAPAPPEDQRHNELFPIPAAFMVCPSAPDRREFAEEMIGALGGVSFGERFGPPSNHRLVDQIRMRRTRLIALNDIENLFDGDGGDIRRCLSLMHYLWIRCGVAFVLIGPPGIEANFQRGPSFATKTGSVRLEQTDRAKELAELTDRFIDHLPLRQPSAPGRELAPLLKAMGASRIGLLRTVLIEAGLVAIEDGSECITPDLLHDEQVMSSIESLVNSFDPSKPKARRNK